MKKYILSAFAVLGAFVSCQLEEPSVDFDDAGEVLYAKIEESGSTKTVMDEHNNILWSSEDQITAFMHSSLGLKYQVDPESVGSASAAFSKVKTESGDNLNAGSHYDHIIAYYPYSESVRCAMSGDGYLLKVVLPSEQTYQTGSFGDGAFPMAAVSIDNDITFKNVCGGIKLRLNGTMRVTSISISGNNGEKLSGNAEVTVVEGDVPAISMGSDASSSVVLKCGSGVQLVPGSDTDFIISLPPVVFTKGFTVVIKGADGQSHIVNTDKENTVIRSSLLVMPAITVEAGELVIKDGDYVDEYGINHGPGVNIDGYIWAPVNCGYHKDLYPWGKLYQFGRRYGQGYCDDDYMDASDPEKLTKFMNLNETQSKVYENTFFLTQKVNIYGNYRQSEYNVWAPLYYWDEKYNPCPEGWSVPRNDALRKLSQNKSVWTVSDGVTGYWYSGETSYSEQVPRVFLPSAGMRSADGVVKDRCDEGYYWTIDWDGSALWGDIGIAYLAQSNGMLWGYRNSGQGMSVRCVRNSSTSSPVYVSEVLLNEESITIEKYSKYKLAATITPDNASVKNIVWDSDNHEVAIVTSSGEVQALSEGKALISARAGNKTAYCKVVVTARTKHEGDYIDEYGINYGPGIEFGGKIYAPVSCGYHPEFSPDGKNYQWGRKYGQHTKVKAEILEGPVSLYEGQSEENADKYISASGKDWLINPNNNLWYIETNGVRVKTEYDPCPDGWIVPTMDEMTPFISNSAQMFFSGNSSKISFGVGEVSNQTDPLKISLPLSSHWSSTVNSDNYVLMLVNESGMLLYYSDNYKQSSNKIRCVKMSEGIAAAKPVTSIMIKASLTLECRQTATLRAAMSPSDPTHDTIEWSSDNPSIADVDNTGKVTAKSAGTTVIRASAGLVSGTCKVTVNPKENAVRYYDEAGNDYGTGIDIDGTIWAPVNCGYDPEKYPYGKLYQWGRISGQGYSDGTYADAVLPEIKEKTIYYDSQLEEYDNWFFVGSSTYYDGWAYYLDSDVWNAGTDKSPKKSVYDPCPEGWRVPTDTEMSNLVKNKSREETHEGKLGIWFTGSKFYRPVESRIFLPLAGYRNYSGTTYGREKQGYYWTSSKSYYLEIYYSASVSYMYSNVYLANGYSLRCVQEDPDATMIPVTRVSLSSSAVTMKPEGTFTLSASVYPSNATNKKVTWTSSDPFVATVDQNGTVTAHSEGQAVITAKSGFRVAECEVTVEVEYKEGRYVDEYGVDHGEGINIDGKIWAPVNCGYHANDFKYGKLYQNGRKYGQGSNESGKSDAVVPEVEAGPVTLEVGQSVSKRNVFFATTSEPYEWLDMDYGNLWNAGTEEAPVKTEYDPCPHGWRIPSQSELNLLMSNHSEETTYNNLKGYWYSGSSAYSVQVPSVFLPHAGAMWSEGKGGGRNVWNSYAHSNIGSKNLSFASSIRCVKDTDELADIPVTALSATVTSDLFSGLSAVVNVTVYPHNATDQHFTYSSSNEAVAQVSEGGVVRAVADGTAEITVRCGNHTAKCTVKVWSATDYINLSGQNLGKGTYIDGVMWAPENEYDYYSYWNSFNNVCPSGWRLPTRNEVSLLMRNGSNFRYTGSRSYSEGISSVYIPPMGRYNMDSDKEGYQSEGTYAYVWTSDTYGGWRYFVYGSKNGGSYEDADNGLYKLSVRCVQEH